MQGTPLERLYNRLQAYERSREADVLLSPEAVRDAADVLTDSLGEQSTDNELVLMPTHLWSVGWFCWYRMVVRKLPVDQDELAVGLFCLALLDLQEESWPLPPGVGDALTTTFGAERSLQGIVHDLVETLAHAAVTSDDPQVVDSSLVMEGGALCLRILLRLIGPDNSLYAHWQSNLGVILMRRARAGTSADPDPASLGRAITAYRAALDHGSTQGLEMGSHLLGLTVVLELWHTVTGEPHEELPVLLNQMLRQIQDNGAVPSPEFALQIAGLAFARTKFTGLSTSEDDKWLQNFEQMLRVVIGLLSARDHPALPYARHLLGTALLLQRSKQQSLEDLDEIVDLFVRALDETATDEPHHGTLLRNLSAAFALREAGFDDGSASHLPRLDQHIDVMRAAVDAAPETESFVLDQLGSAYLHRYMISRDGSSHTDDDLNDALTFLERAVDLGADDAVFADVSRHRLILALAVNHERDAPDLRLTDRVIRLARAASGPPAYGGESLVQHVLDDALISRHRMTGDSDSLIEAANRLHEDFQSGTDVRKPVADAWRSALVELWRLTGSRQYLDEAITAQRGSVEGSDPDTDVGAARRGVLAIVLALADQADTGHAELLEAISLTEEIVSDAAGPPTERTRRYLPLLADLLLRADMAGVLDDLDRVVAVARRAVALRPAGAPSWGHHAYVLGAALGRRHQRTANATDLREARLAMSRALDDRNLTPSERIQVSSVLGILASSDGDWEEALTAFRSAIDLLPQAASPRGQHTDQQRQLSGQGDVVSLAASCAITVGRPDLALELLEQGRGILLSRATLSRDPDTTTRLEAEHPELARRFHEIVRARDSSWHVGAVDLNGEANSDLRHELDSAFVEILAEIRQLPGYDRFLEPLSADRLRQAAAHGPVVVVNVSPYRCDALIVTVSETAVVPLPNLTSTDVTTQLQALFAALRARLSEDALKQAAASNRIRGILDWLWRTVAHPVVTALGLTDAGDDRPGRLWWCPTGLLSFLPLHAAAARDGTAFLPDLAVCSYTPTLRALEHARRRPTAEGSSLVVAVPEPPGASPLPGVRREAASVAALLPEATFLEGADAVRETVLSRLAGDVRIAHFACHADADPFDASRSALLLQDGPLTTREIARLETGTASLAYLSACSTAQGVVGLTDEAVHLAGTFHLAGFRNVISTLWPISDEVAAEAATLFYQRLADQHGQDPAAAVTHVLRALRDQYGPVPTLWAGLLHMGP
ncbi:CHAT domain-containing protein [Streptomyces sp. NPDC046985]|uniref:CHAT domain-containing protein n=1 Tax=Streptomyces sp. NPDC046985 TaxID=3155377 RepID=UPI0033CB2170